MSDTFSINHKLLEKELLQ